jgi:hypothetical protein
MNPKWIRWYLDSGEYTKSCKRLGAFWRACDEHREVLNEPLTWEEWYKKCPPHLKPGNDPYYPNNFKKSAK